MKTDISVIPGLLKMIFFIMMNVVKYIVNSEIPIFPCHRLNNVTEKCVSYAEKCYQELKKIMFFQVYVIV